MSPSSSRRATTTLALVLGLALATGLSSQGCLEPRDAGPQREHDDNCTSCHGSPTREGDRVLRSAPPFDTAGEMESARVGAHLQHLLPNDIHAGVACEECHVVPENTDDPGHADSASPAELTFGILASTDGASPSYDADEHRCSDAYCHGGNDVGWEPTETAPPRCERCHGDPPPPPHPPVSECSRCHGEVIDDQKAFIAPERHIDGVVDVITLECNTCHGSDETGVPPPDLEGNTSVSALGVGAHQAHLSGGNNSRAVACTECHTVPDEIADPDHIDGELPAEVIFTGVAATDGRTPVWDRDAASCTQSWCHGPTAPDGSISPAWTSEDGALGCTACHGTPPAAPHPPTDRCEVCHGAVVDANMAITEPTLHVDGIVQMTLPTVCNGCHGTADDGSPPPDLSGNTDTSSPGVGMHQAHLTTTWARPVPCGECHVVPTDILDPAHMDGAAPAEVSFSGVATQFGIASYDGGGQTCANIYCHGENRNWGGSFTGTLSWTTVAGNETNCHSCHGFPPLPPHPANAFCPTCHANVVNPDFDIIAPMLHINGQTDF